MDDNLRSVYESRIVTSRNEFFGITCLAIIGAISIIGTIADRAYRIGRDTKEVEMKRDFKKYMKNLRKNKP